HVLPKMVGWGAGKRSDDRASASAGSVRGQAPALRRVPLRSRQRPNSPPNQTQRLLTALLGEGRVDVAVLTHGIDTTGPAGRCLFRVGGSAFRCVEGGGGQCANR